MTLDSPRSMAEVLGLVAEPIDKLATTMTDLLNFLVELDRRITRLERLAADEYEADALDEEADE